MKSLVMGLTLCLVHLGARAQEAPTVDVKTRLASMAALADEVIAAGKVGQTGLKAEWRKLKTQAGESAIPVLRMIGTKASAVAADPKLTAEAVAPKVAELSKVMASLAAQGLAIDAEVAAAAGAATGVRQEILQTLQRQLAATETLNEIKAFTAKGNAGWYDGMFPKTAALAERGIEAFNHVFVTSDYAREVRLLAGEGLAQSGTKKYGAGDSATALSWTRTSKRSVSTRRKRSRTCLGFRRSIGRPSGRSASSPRRKSPPRKRRPSSSRCAKSSWP